MLQVIRFILSSIIDFMKMLFSVNVDNGLSLGTLFCICFILLPIVLRIVNFIRQDAIDELNSKYDSGEGILFHREYTGKHEPVGRHSKEYFRRQKVARRFEK